MFLDSFLGKIGDFFSGLFSSAKKTWAKLSPEIQNALLHGSGIIATINKYVDAAPQFVIDAIVAKYPDLHIDQITQGLKKVAVALNIAIDTNDDDLTVVISKLQQYLASTKDDGKVWATISHSLAALLAVVLSPAETKVASVTSLLEFVYQHFIKGDVQPTVETEQ